MPVPRWFSQLPVAVLSIGLAFFSVLNVLFSDRNGIQDTLSALAFVLVAYAILSSIVHLASRRKTWTWFWWLVGPGAVMGVGYSLTDMSAIGWYQVCVLISMLAGTWFGRWLGGLRRSGGQPAATPEPPK